MGDDNEPRVYNPDDWGCVPQLAFLLVAWPFLLIRAVWRHGK